jgi:HPt (histidine-containing phosphotransfer) domain-containing protein
MTSPEPDVLDVAVLEELRASVQDDAAFVVELIEAYLVDGAAHIEAIGAAVDDGDAGALVRPAHTLKSSSATLGAARIARTARELEVLGRTGSLGSQARDLLALVQEEWPATTEALRVWAGRASAG